MSTSLVIVAIPEEQDRVWKVSSEQVPHLTLLHLGDVSQVQNLDQIMQFVDHAVTLSEHGPFYLDVERRGTLGDKEADVLFFNKRSWNLKWIRQFRGQLLQNQAIRTAFDSTDQILEAPQEWLPHLTLGYPDKPAQPIQNDSFDHPFYSVCFDRIAVWAEDFNGPEFQLEWPDRELEGDLAVAYSDMAKAGVRHYAMNGTTPASDPRELGEQFFEHFGIKGMRWGQRKTETVTVKGKTKQVTPRKAAKLDKKWERNIYALPGAIAVHNGMADHFNKRIGSLNDKFKDDFSKTDWGKPETWTAREKKYNDAVNALTTEGNRIAVKEVHGTSPTGKRRAELSEDGTRVVVREVKVQHAADNSDVVAVLKLTRNQKGLITQAEPLVQEEDMSQVVSPAIHGAAFVEGLMHASVLDNANVAAKIKAKIQSILDDVTGDGDGDIKLFGDPLVRTKIQSVLQDFYQDPNVDNAIVYDALGEKFLEHFGIKGMRWGVRKADPIKSKSGHTIIRGKAKVDVEGGGGHPAHPDAIKVAEAKTKLKKSGPAALSNEELRTVANRLQLEGQVHQLVKSKGKRFVSRHLEDQSNQLVREGLREGARRGIKRAARVAGTAAAVAAI